MNKVILVGNLTRDIELRHTPNGSAIAAFGLAVNRNWTDKASGDKKSEVMFIDVNIFGRSAEIANQYLSIGKKVLIEGRLKLDQWQDQHGQNRSKHTIVCESFEFLDPKDQNSGTYQQSGGQNPQSYGGQGNQSSGSYNTPDITIQDDQIPF